MAFWLPSYRSFKHAIGEMTAAAAGIHVSVRVAGEAAAAAGGDDPWAELARRVGVRVDGLDQQRVSRTASALGLVAIYSAFDAFVRELRGDWHSLAGVEWQQFKGDTPLQEIRRNAPNGIDIGNDESVIEYYRRCRNWIVHPAEATLSEAKAYFGTQAAALSEARAAWDEIGNCSAPHGPESLEFDDLKFFARVALHIGEVISSRFDPGNQAIAGALPLASWPRLAHDPIRLRRRAAGFLQTEWGLPRSRAEEIAAIAITAT
ncbi:MAG TPA: hypothetical protein VFS23_22450 [Vicinamibacterales bacterium]|jgi:hypothetical protein|nr:hypothetical protein [Vicinamibacterales bacterium]